MAVEPLVAGHMDEGDAAKPDGPEAVECYIDCRRVSESEANAFSRDHLLGVFGAKGDPNDQVLRLYYFSSEDQKLAFADAEDIPLRRCHEAEAALAQYAESSGTVQSFETTGMIPQSFRDYSDGYTADYFPELAKVSPTSAPFAFGHYGKDLYGGPTLAMISGKTPAFILGWDNAISRYYVLLSYGIVYGYVSFFDKTFWRQKFYEAWNWTNNTVRFEGALAWANDRASSALIL